MLHQGIDESHGTATSGPDLLNSLLGILLCFREYPVAILAKVEIMFMQIAVKQEV